MTPKSLEKIAHILRDYVSDPSQRAMLACEFADMFRQEFSNFNKYESKFFADTKRGKGITHYYPDCDLTIID